jgi:hypothetical protein
MRLPIQVTGSARTSIHGQMIAGYVQAQAIFTDSEGNFYSCTPLYSEGPITYLDCRKLTGDIGVFEPPGYCWTETKCVLKVFLLCRDHCIPPGGREVKGNWYPCGACVDFEFFAQATSSRLMTSI